MPFIPTIMTVDQYTTEAERVLRTLLALQLDQRLVGGTPACDVSVAAFGERVYVRWVGGPIEVRLDVGHRKCVRDFKGEIAANKMSGFHMLTDEAQEKVKSLIKIQEMGGVYECETEVSWASTHLSPMDAVLFAQDVRIMAEAAAHVEHHFRNVVIDFSRSK